MFHEETTGDDFVIESVDTLPRLTVYNNQGEPIGYVELHDLPNAVSRDEFDHFKHDFVQFRNLVSRLQSQFKMLEARHARGG